MARYMRQYGQSDLRPPAVIGAGRVNPGLRIKLAPPVFSADRQLRRRAKSRLRPPAVIAGGIAWHGPGVYLTYPTVGFRSRKQTHPRLQSPAVVTQPLSAAAPNLTLAPSRRLVAKSHLLPPVVVGGGIAWHGPGVYLTRPTQPPVIHSKLRPPAVAEVVVAETYYGPGVTLAPSRRPVAKSSLHPPAILASSGPSQYVLTYSRRGAPHSFLRPPTDTIGLEDQGRVAAHLAYSRRGRPTSFLSPPTDTVGLEDQGRLSTHLAYSRRGHATWKLQPPIVVFTEAQVYYGPSVSLAPSRRPVSKSRLFPPAVVGAGKVNPGLRIKLAFGRSTPGFWRLSPPAVVAAVVADVYYGPTVTLAPSRRPRTLSGLAKLIVLPEGPQGGVMVSLAPQRRGKPRSFLRPAVVVTPPAVIYYGPATSLAYSRRGRPKSVLRPPRVVFPFFARRADTTLAPQRRGRPTSFLSPPAILRERGQIQVTLAPQRRGKAKPFLRPPVVVRLAVEIYGPETQLAYSRRGRPKSFLEPPAVVGRFPFRGILIHLAYSRRGRPISFRQPEVVGQRPFRGIQVYLTRNKPQPVSHRLFPPVVIGPGIAFFGPQVTLVRIKHPPVQHNLRLTLVAFRRPGGDVCGFDIAGSFVCEIQLPGSRVSGSDSAVHGVTGTSRAATKITGSDSAGGSVSGSDRKAT